MMPVSMQVHIHHRNVDIQFSADDAFLECLSQFPVEHIKCINTVKVASYWQTDKNTPPYNMS
jgi:hypothetical protein